MKHPRHPKALHEEVIGFYRKGYMESELLANRDRLSEINPLGQAWLGLNKSTLGRWLRKAKEADLDLEIWHLLNRRNWKPGRYTHWEPNGLVILARFYDPITDTLFLGPGAAYIPLGGANQHTKVVHTGPEWEVPTGPRMRDRDAAGPYVAELKSLGYSHRDIRRLWKGSRTRRGDVDRSPKVRLLVNRLQSVRRYGMGIATISRILQTYQHIDNRDAEVRIQEPPL